MVHNGTDTIICGCIEPGKMCRSQRELMRLQSLSWGRRCLVVGLRKRVRFGAEEETAAAESWLSSRAAQVNGHIRLKPSLLIEFRKNV